VVTLAIKINDAYMTLHMVYSLDWTAGLTQNGVKNVFSSLFQRRREANYVYSAYFFGKFLLP